MASKLSLAVVAAIPFPLFGPTAAVHIDKCCFGNYCLRGWCVPAQGKPSSCIVPAVPFLCPLSIALMLAIIMPSTISAIKYSMLQMRSDVIKSCNSQHQVQLQLSASEYHGVRSINACSSERLLHGQHDQKAHRPASC